MKETVCRLLKYCFYVNKKKSRSKLILFCEGTCIFLSLKSIFVMALQVRLQVSILWRVTHIMPNFKHFEKFCGLKQDYYCIKLTVYTDLWRLGTCYYMRTVVQLLFYLLMIRSHGTFATIIDIPWSPENILSNGIALCALVVNIFLMVPAE